MMTTGVFGQRVTDATTRTHCSGSGWQMGGMGIWWVIGLAAVILGLIWLFRVGFARRPRSDQDALAILERRFAEDEISFDDYRGRRAFLTGAQKQASHATVGSPTGHGHTT